MAFYDSSTRAAELRSRLINATVNSHELFFLDGRENVKGDEDIVAQVVGNGGLSGLLLEC